MVDITTFNLINIIDTCSIWNILSSKILYNKTQNVKCYFACTKYVVYECFYKPRKTVSEQDVLLQERLQDEKAKGHFPDFHISIEDLQDIEILTKRKNLSKGELSSMVFAKRLGHAFLTDDQGARKLASQFMDSSLVQTTPRLFGWLIYEELLNDSDVKLIIQEHEEFNRPLSPYLLEVYQDAMKFRLLKKAE